MGHRTALQRRPRGVPAAGLGVRRDAVAIAAVRLAQLKLVQDVLQLRFNTTFAVAAAFAAIACAPLAPAEPGGGQAALGEPFSEAGGPFVGSWHAHGEGLTINADGSATEITNTRTLHYRFSTVQELTAYGNQPDGSYVTVTLVDGGRGLTLTAAGADQGFPFCKTLNGFKANSADCGA